MGNDGIDFVNAEVEDVGHEAFESGSRLLNHDLQDLQEFFDGGATQRILAHDGG